jgi:hypothetical protein
LEKEMTMHPKAGVLVWSPEFKQRVVRSDDASRRPPGRQ